MISTRIFIIRSIPSAHNRQTRDASAMLFQRSLARCVRKNAETETTLSHRKTSGSLTIFRTTSDIFSSSSFFHPTHSGSGANINADTRKCKLRRLHYMKYLFEKAQKTMYIIYIFIVDMLRA